MSDENKEQETTVADVAAEENAESDKKNFLMLYIAIGLFAVGCILFALAFVIRGAGVYLLVSCMISTLAAVSFLNAQKRHGENTLCKVIRILSYAVMIAALVVFVIGMSVGSANK